jgi:hypothetical protein
MSSFLTQEAAAQESLLQMRRVLEARGYEELVPGCWTKKQTSEEQALQKQADKRTQATAMRNALGLTPSQQAFKNIRCEGCDD